ncbi:MAG: UvrD-helicase domain-containing protein [bacterium]|nr:UvrD-helicase domain-containing protein [bacterium]
MNLDFLEQLNEKQKKAVVHTTGPALVLAGAGSGKTRVLTQRVAYLLATQNLRPEQILLVTFTNKAALEMKSRVRNLTNYDLPFSGTFHSFATRVLRRHALAAKLDPNFTIYDSDDQLALLKQIYKDNGWDPKDYKPQAVKAAISNAKNFLQTPEDYRQAAYGDFGEFVANAYEVYQRALKREAALDFDDLLNETLRLLQADSHVRNFYQEQIQFVLIDEYQDTNKVQYRLSKILSAPQNNLFVVGDFSQSIYAWRGADYTNMLSFQKDFPQVTTYHLDQNYRSHQAILTAATQIIQKNTDHPILNLWTSDKTPMKIKLVEAESGNQEADWVASEIKRLRDDENLNLQEIAILYRTNAQSRAFEEALTRHRLPYRLVGGFKFYERKEIKDLLAYLRLYFNPKESVSLKRVLKIGKRRYNQYLDWREKYQEQTEKEETPLKLLQEIMQATKYRELYDPTEPEEAVKLENINELLAHSSQFNETLNFLENIALIQDDYLPDDAGAEQEQDQVQLMSLHSAKGLEFKAVFMVGMEENLLPHSRSLFDAAQLSEERRLCYVGITRAKEKLYFTCARRRWQYGVTTMSCRSRFLDDLDDKLLEIERLDEYVPEQVTPWQPRRARRQDFRARVEPENHERRFVPDEDVSAALNGDLDLEVFLRS